VTGLFLAFLLCIGVALYMGFHEVKPDTAIVILIVVIAISMVATTIRVPRRRAK